MVGGSEMNIFFGFKDKPGIIIKITVLCVNLPADASIRHA
jgi:hypothetical protein